MDAKVRSQINKKENRMGPIAALFIVSTVFGFVVFIIKKIRGRK